MLQEKSKRVAKLNVMFTIKTPYFDIPVVYEDDNIVVVNKPHGLLVIEDRYDKDLPTLKNILQEKYGQIYVVHRLDFGTGGVMVFARDKNTHKYLNFQFEGGIVEKEYFAVVKGTGFAPVTVMLPISSKNSHGKYKINFKSGKKAITSFVPVKEYNGKTLVKAVPFTGRTHQIRVHLKTIKFPLVNDFLYNEKTDDKRLTLMCYKLKFMHPEDKKQRIFQTEISEYLKSFLK
jgi:RluA family pseudouridine synthase